MVFRARSVTIFSQNGTVWLATQKLFDELNQQGTTLIIATHDESIYKNSNHRKVELEHGLFSQHTTQRQLPLLNMKHSLESSAGRDN